MDAAAKGRRVGQISTEQRHLDTFLFIKTQADCRLVVKNDQLGLFGSAAVVFFQKAFVM